MVKACTDALFLANRKSGSFQIDDKNRAVIGVTGMCSTYQAHSIPVMVWDEFGVSAYNSVESVTHTTSMG